MYYYHVWVRSNRYRGKQALTYSFARKLAPGTVIRVPLQHQIVYGVVINEVHPPRQMTIKPIAETVALPAIPAELLKTAEWLRAYYRSSVGAVTQALLPAAIPRKIPAAAVPPPPFTRPEMPPLTPEQTAALGQFNGPGTYLLHGRTGSGKTRVYLALAERELAAGRSVLVLSPEIGLTSQLAANFAVFGTERIVVLHSGMTNAERFRAWHRIGSATDPLVIIGARSAIFSPLRNIGLIVVDEAHEPAYKQEQEPRYLASRVAAVLAQTHKARLVLGSATPSVVDYSLAEERERPIIRLSQLAKATKFSAEIKVVDLKNKEDFSRSAHLSNQLIGAMTTSLHRGEQILLYLNRRGTARVSLCQNCGWQGVCPNCDLPLTYHGDTHVLRCHICNFVTNTPTSCPVCGHSELLFKSAGTKAIVSEVARLFPDARISRFDSDNTKLERFENNYNAAIQGDIDILIGTQTLVKGIDLPRLSCLGVINADTSLQLPDFSASERTYQLINQVIGRVQRGHRNTTAVIQTYDPQSPLLHAALHDNWGSFYASELSERKAFGYPPYVHLLRITCRRKSAKSAESACEKIRQHILHSHPKLEVDGPSPSLHEKFKDTYSWQLVIKARARYSLLEVVDALPSTVTSYDLDPIDLL